jgi:parallel beta-helix repeat protein
MSFVKHWLFCVALASAFALAPDRAIATDCGGRVACECGDRVVQNTTLTQDIGVCRGNGLSVLSGVVLDCAGHTVTGSNLPGAWYGIDLNQVEGAEVRNCRVTLFRRGIRLRGGSGNLLSMNESFTNRYGIDVAGATTNNVLSGNHVHDNRDEGIHLGTDSNQNEVSGNEISYNKHENLYLLQNRGNLVARNLIHHTDGASIYVKHSSDNRFVANELRDGALHVRGDSTGNVFKRNSLKGNGYLFDAYQAPTGWVGPHGNTMSDDLIRKTDVCFRFLGAYDNHATGLTTDGRCAPMTEGALGGIQATGNTVVLAPPTN